MLAIVNLGLQTRRRLTVDDTTEVGSDPLIHIARRRCLVEQQTHHFYSEMRLLQHLAPHTLFLAFRLLPPAARQQPEGLAAHTVVYFEQQHMLILHNGALIAYRS